MTQQNEPPRIQSEGRQIEVGKEAIGLKREPAKSKKAPRGSITRASKIAGVSTCTIKLWRNEGVNVLDDSALLVRKQKPHSKRMTLIEKEDALDYSEKHGVGFYRARQILKTGKKPQVKQGVTTTIRYMGSPSYWNHLRMVQYRAELRAFPDWGVLWRKHKANEASKDKWHSLPVELRQEKNRRKPKDMARRRQKLREADRRRCRASPHYRTLNSLQSRFRKFFVGGTSRSIRKLIGCTLPEFKKHLESQFKKGMTWQNYGSHWHVDHIIGCANFDHSDPAQVAICWHWTNLQPLEAKANMRKGKRIYQPQMNLRMEFAA